MQPNSSFQLLVTSTTLEYDIMTSSRLWLASAQDIVVKTRMVFCTKERKNVKKLINNPDDVVKEALAGMQALHADLIRVDFENQTVVRADAPVRGKVGVISGGGSGHEPMHGGFVGHGMLDAACAGAVFTSPVPDQMLAATKAVNGGAGVLHIVKNYTGDVLNFQMAAELAEDEDIEVAAVVTNDDVAVQDSLYTAGRRGVGATVFVEKIAGALAEEGAGIHGEPGRTRATLAPARDLAAAALDAIGADMPLSGDLLVMVNGMGGTPLLELYVLFNEVRQYLEGQGARIARNLVGNYITSLEMQGFSVTVCQLTDTLTRLWDAPVDTPALRWGR